MKTALALLCIVALSGCANLTSPARSTVLEDNKGYWFDYDAARRGTLLVPQSSQLRACSEPSPDVALALVSKLEASLGKEGVGEASGKGEFSSSVVKLAERTTTVMFLRESLYRLCEQSLNQNFTKEEILAAYEKVIDAALEIVKTDKTNAETELVKARTLNELIEKGTPVENIPEQLMR